jgi:hypothetical protein
MPTQDEYYRGMLDQILGRNAVTPGRFMNRNEAQDPVLRDLMLERLYGRQPGMLERAANAVVPAAEAAQPAGPVVYQVVSKLHGPVGTFNTRVEANAFVKQHGITVGPKGGHFVQAVPIR